LAGFDPVLVVHFYRDNLAGDARGNGGVVRLEIGVIGPNIWVGA
jgi:hypothetical protein